MLDRVIDLLLKFIGLFRMFFYVAEYEQVVILRCGKFSRTRGAGPHWIAPLGIEEALVDNVVPTTTALGVQSLHTKDDQHINIQGVLLWKITDIRKVLIEVEAANDALTDASMGCISNMVAQNDWDYIRSPEFVRRLKSMIQEQAREWGIKVMKVYISDCSKTRAIRMWHEGL